MNPFSGLIDRIIRNPAMFAIDAIILVVAITLHEWGHAFVASRRGDPLPEADGRVTLNPLAHLDPMGTVGMFFCGFGWGKPVRVSREDWRVSIAGPAMNLFQALFFGLTLRAFHQNGVAVDSTLRQILAHGFGLNIGLAVFNLIPVGPLDGASILKAFLPLRNAYGFYRFNQQYGALLMLVVVFTGVLGTIIGPVEFALAQVMGIPPALLFS